MGARAAAGLYPHQQPVAHVPDGALPGIDHGAPDAFAMAHQPITWPGGSLTEQAVLPGRTFYIHMNDTNPVLDRNSKERARVEGCSVEIAADGMDIEL